MKSLIGRLITISAVAFAACYFMVSFVGCTAGEPEKLEIDKTDKSELKIDDAAPPNVKSAGIAE